MIKFLVIFGIGIAIGFFMGALFTLFFIDPEEERTFEEYAVWKQGFDEGVCYFERMKGEKDG